MTNLKKLSEMPEKLTPGHRLCAGCGAAIAARQILMGTDNPVVAAVATGCLEVATTIYPYTAWNIPFIHNAFENAAATISGVETAWRALQSRGRLPTDKPVKFVVFGGWRFKQQDTVKIAKLAVDTCFWPLYEITDGTYRLNYKPRKKRDITDWLSAQGRFGHLFDPEQTTMIAHIQKEVDARWSKLLSLCEQSS